MNYLNRNGLVDRVAKEYSMTKQDTRAWVDAIFDVLGQAIIEEDVVIYGFGAFKHRDRAPRVGRDINKGTEIIIPARTSIQFDLSDKLYGQLNSDKGGVVDAETYESED